MAHFAESDAFSPAEKIVLRLAIAMTKTPATVDNELFAGLCREFSEIQLVELATVIS